VEFIGNVFGPNCEVLLHDLRNLENSIIAICNNSITNRKVGGTITDFGLNMIKNNEYANKSFVANYIGKKGDKTLRSSTYFIKDTEGNTIGMMCINIDISRYEKITDELSQLFMLDKLLKQQNGINEENFMSSIDELIDSMIDETVKECGAEIPRMTEEEKKGIVSKLDKKGAFLIKGAVEQVAGKLGVSEQTIYRYMKDTR